MIRRFAWLGLFLACGSVLGTSSPVMAQVINGGSARWGLYNATRNFLYNRPTVSPYVNLATMNTGGGLPNYFTLVRPQIEAREAEMAQRQQATRMQRDLNQVQQQMAESQSQMTNMMLTGRVGWSSRGMPRFGSYMNFYPGFQQIPRR